MRAAFEIPSVCLEKAREIAMRTGKGMQNRASTASCRRKAFRPPRHGPSRAGLKRKSMIQQATKQSNKQTRGMHAYLPPRLVSLQGRSRVLPFPHSGGKSGTTSQPPSLGPIPPRESPSGSLPVRSSSSWGPWPVSVCAAEERKKERKKALGPRA